MIEIRHVPSHPGDPTVLLLLKDGETDLTKADRLPEGTAVTLDDPDASGLRHFVIVKQSAP